DLLFGLYDTVFVYNNLKNKGYIVSTGLPETEGNAREKRAKERLNRFKRAISTPMVSEDGYPLGYTASDEIKKNFSRDDYVRAIERVLKYISAGDAYQINLSQRFSLPLPCPPLNIYERLREINPAPMGAFLNLGDFQILSNSPERFFKVKDKTIRTFPVKGTKKRGVSPEEDHNLIRKLREDPKENAEHIMIVDLERNDLGRVCRHGSVMVEELNRIETYPTLHHIVSRISGRLREDVEISNIIEAMFPGGSITGAPKIRAMEIIDEIEPTSRGIYTGAIGYIDFSGNVDFNIAIRTAVAHKGMIHYQAGGGIVADSDPEKEHEETLLKAKAFFNAIGFEQRQGGSCQGAGGRKKKLHPVPCTLHPSSLLC
ncbi:MAG: aminodeoxychorismate synthase component I, partial [Thermodesulfobacteriota bacterium]